jgi:hypothetical protein
LRDERTRGRNREDDANDPERTSSPQFALGFSVVSAPEALAQLEGGDAEHPLQMRRRDRAGIHARSLEYRCEP